jgi:hypothetical protein
MRTRSGASGYDSMSAMKKLLDLFARRRPGTKVAKPPLFRSYLAFYNGAMETVSGRYFLRNNEQGDR